MTACNTTIVNNDYLEALVAISITFWLQSQITQVLFDILCQISTRCQVCIGMAGIDISDKNAWDDSFLQDSWNAAVAEYEVGSQITFVFQ